MAEQKWDYRNALMANGFNLGRMAQEEGPQLVVMQIHLEMGKSLSICFSVEHARELAEVLLEEANNPIFQGRA